MIAKLGPSTPYELKQAVELTVGHFWPFAHSQLYSEPAKLVGEGLLSEERESTGRRRRRFTITEAGRDEMRAWLADTNVPRVEIRDQGLLRLFFHEQGTEGDFTRLATHLARSYQDMVVALEAVDTSAASDEAMGAAQEPGVSVMRTIADFWQARAEVEDDRDADS